MKTVTIGTRSILAADELQVCLEILFGKCDERGRYGSDAAEQERSYKLGQALKQLSAGNWALYTTEADCDDDEDIKWLRVAKCNTVANERLAAEAWADLKRLIYEEAGFGKAVELGAEAVPAEYLQAVCAVVEREPARLQYELNKLLEQCNAVAVFKPAERVVSLNTTDKARLAEAVAKAAAMSLSADAVGQWYKQTTGKEMPTAGTNKLAEALSQPKQLQIVERAIERGLMSRTASGYCWHKSKVLLAYFIGRVYCNDSVKGYYGADWTSGGKFPDAEVVQLFGLGKKIGDLRRQKTSGGGEPPRGYELIEDIIRG